MKKTSQQPRQQPPPRDIQAVQQLMQSGQLRHAETTLKTLLAQYPGNLALYNLLGFCQQGQGKNREAVVSFRTMLTIEPRLAEIHFNLGILLTQLDEPHEAIASYRSAVQLKPDFTAAHFNLGILLQAQSLLSEAIMHYRQAIAIEPGFFQALGNLGAVLQQQGQLEEAEQCYRKALAVHTDARGYFNLGTALYDQGKHEQAIVAFREALTLEPRWADVWNSLGETLRDRGEMNEAIQCYERALLEAPQHSRAHYNMGEYLCLAGRLLEAIAYFEQSQFADAPQRVLQCLYKTRQFEVFKQKFDQISTQHPHTSVLIGALSTHYAINFGVDNHYQFCKNPMTYVVQQRIDALAEPHSDLLNALLHDIQHLAIAERKQGRLYDGIQSAGNLLKRSESSFQQLATLIRQHLVMYQQQFSDCTDEFIRHFPQQIDFTSSWYLRMKQGGYLTSHIHEEGWISGCVYLALPMQTQAHEGSFVYGTDGDDYPRLHEQFPSHVVDLQVGDLVLFPSSLFHRTLPFNADQERVCIAFDVKPMLS